DRRGLAAVELGRFLLQGHARHEVSGPFGRGVGRVQVHRGVGGRHLRHRCQRAGHRKTGGHGEQCPSCSFSLPSYGTLPNLHLLAFQARELVFSPAVAVLSRSSSSSRLVPVVSGTKYRTKKNESTPNAVKISIDGPCPMAVRMTGNSRDTRKFAAQ